MGLLEKATRLRDDNREGTPTERLGRATVGLRARAEAMRDSSQADRSARHSSGGVQIRGLLARAQALREAGEEGPSESTVTPEEQPGKGGLLARAEALKGEGPRPEPTRSAPSTASAEYGSAPTARTETLPEPEGVERESASTGVEARDEQSPPSDIAEDLDLVAPPGDAEARSEAPAASPDSPWLESSAEQDTGTDEDEDEFERPASPETFGDPAAGPAEVLDDDLLAGLVPDVPDEMPTEVAGDSEVAPVSDGDEPRGLLERAQEMADGGDPAPARDDVDDGLIPDPLSAPESPAAEAEGSPDMAAPGEEGAETADGLGSDPLAEAGADPEEPAGLLDRAQHMLDQEPEDSSPPAYDGPVEDPLTDGAAAALDSDEPVADLDLPDAEIDAERPLALNLDDEPYLGDEDPSASSQESVPDEMGDSEEDADLDADLDWPDELPDFMPPLEGGQDPALDGQEDREVPADEMPEETDLFDEWRREAEREAEQEARQLERQDESTRSVAPRYDDNLLFDADSDFTTAPAEAHFASQKKIDHYLSLFDISKEISQIDDFAELWDNVLYALMGQVGAETICIFSTASKARTGATFFPVAHSGFELPEGWSLSPGDELYDRMAQEDATIRYADELLTPSIGLPEQERTMLETSKAQMVVPLKNMNRMYGIVLLGPQLEGEDYSIDDVEFLGLLGEVAASGVDRVLSRLEHERDTEDLRRRNEMHGKMFQFARRTSRLKSLDDLYDTMTKHLREDFGVSSYSLVLLSPRDQTYRLFAGNQISPESVERFRLPVNSDLIAMVSNLIRVYELSDFREHPELTAAYTNDDLALMQHYWIVPLINMNWLVGFITIHGTSTPWTEFHREMIVSSAEIISAVFANSIMLGERETLFRDPFSPLEERLKTELKRANEFQSPVALVDIRVKNIKRILELNPPEQVTDFLAAVHRGIGSFLYEADFLARVGQGRFAMILPGRGRDEAEILVKKLFAEFKRLRLLPGSPVRVVFDHTAISAPADTKDAGKMLAILD